jgi:GGDEF domain-containing protein
MKTLLDMICPCHLVVNEGGNIQHLGPGLTKIISRDAYLHEDLFSVFHLTRPAGLATMRNVIDYTGRSITMHLRKEPDIKLRAVAVPDPMSNNIVLNVGFGIGVQNAIRKFGLTMKDFAPTDVVPDLLYLIEANQSAMSASKRLTLRLQGAKALAEEQAFTDTLTGLKNRRAFDVILPFLVDRMRLEQLCAKMIAGIEEPVRVEDIECSISSSLGVTSFFGGERIEISEILERADKAVYVAKSSGRGCFRFYETLR